MNENSLSRLSRVLFLPHGGGPLPLLGDAGHQQLVDFLRRIPEKLGNPEAVLLISGHWEAPQPTVQLSKHPGLLFDYYGFPEESYRISYNAPGHPGLSRQVRDLVSAGGFQVRLDEHRGFDHGMFVPLKIMYPEANLPTVQLSLMDTLDPRDHIRLGKTLAPLRAENVLIIGSGMSFHNMAGFSSPDSGITENTAFERWLHETCARPGILPKERERRLIDWQTAPSARYCHPREEHLLPLHVCFGASVADTPNAEIVFQETVLGKRVSGILW